MIDGRPAIGSVFIRMERVSANGDSRMKKLGGHCGAKEKSRGLI